MVGAGRFELAPPCAQDIGCPHLGINRFNNLRTLLCNSACKTADDTNGKSCWKCRLRNQSTWARTCCCGRRLSGRIPMWEPGRALLPCTTSAPAGRYGGPGIREYPQGIYRSSARLRPYRGYAEALAMTNPRRQECCDALPRTTNATRNARTSARNMSVAAKKGAKMAAKWFPARGA